MAPEPAAETAGRGVRGRHGQDGGDAALLAFLKPKFCAAWPTPPPPAARMLVSPAAAASPTRPLRLLLGWRRPRRVEAISLRPPCVCGAQAAENWGAAVEGKVCLDSHRRRIRSRSRWPLLAECAALDFRPTAAWIAGIRPGRSGWICRCWRCGWAEGCRKKARLLRCIPAPPRSEDALGSRRLSVLPCFVYWHAASCCAARSTCRRSAPARRSWGG